MFANRYHAAMPRRTKEDSEKTRQLILAAARKEFAKRGVGRTSLDQIAKSAKVTRGAIYWHFKNKTDLFFAMRDQICLPLFDQLGDDQLPADANPLDGIEAFLLEALRGLEEDPKIRQTCEIICTKCEYVDEFETVLDQMIARCADLIGRLAKAYALAKKRGLLRTGADPEALAHDTYLFFSGMIRLWVSDREGKVIRKRVKAMITAHVGLRRK